MSKPDLPKLHEQENAEDKEWDKKLSDWKPRENDQPNRLDKMEQDINLLKDNAQVLMERIFVLEQKLDNK